MSCRGEILCTKVSQMEGGVEMMIMIMTLALVAGAVGVSGATNKQDARTQDYTKDHQ